MNRNKPKATFTPGPVERRLARDGTEKMRLVSVVPPGWLENLAAQSHEYSELMPFEDARVEAEASTRSRLMRRLQAEMDRNRPPRMHPEDRLIMMLSVRDGLSRREIAAAMRKAEGNITRSLRRALKWLRERVAEDDEMSELLRRMRELERASDFYY